MLLFTYLLYADASESAFDISRTLAHESFKYWADGKYQRWLSKRKFLRQNNSI